MGKVLKMSIAAEKRKASKRKKLTSSQLIISAATAYVLVEIAYYFFEFS